MVFTAGHHFQLDGPATLEDVLAGMRAPLSVILQVTKRCDFDCNFCSETLQRPDPPWPRLDTMRANLAGVGRVFLSGGEPLMRRDFGDVVDMYAQDFLLGIPTNATRAHVHAARLVGKVAYVNVGLEGPRAITARVRGDYDKVMAGIRVFQQHGLPLSLSCVVLRSDLHGLPFHLSDRRRDRRRQAQTDHAAAQGETPWTWPSTSSSPRPRPRRSSTSCAAWPLPTPGDRRCG